MSGKDDDLVVSIALLCATWVAISRGSTRRHYFLPLGDPDSPSVAISNLLTARTHAVPYFFTSHGKGECWFVSITNQNLNRKNVKRILCWCLMCCFFALRIATCHPRCFACPSALAGHAWRSSSSWPKVEHGFWNNHIPLWCFGTPDSRWYSGMWECHGTYRTFLLESNNMMHNKQNVFILVLDTCNICLLVLDTWATCWNLRCSGNPFGCLDGEGNHQNEQLYGPTVLAFAILPLPRSMPAWKHAVPSRSWQMSISTDMVGRGIREMPGSNQVSPILSQF